MMGIGGLRMGPAAVSSVAIEDSHLAPARSLSAAARGLE
jgi:hypothetical protein